MQQARLGGMVGDRRVRRTAGQDLAERGDVIGDGEGRRQPQRAQRGQG
ncbi:MAG: hypothetical protein QM662_00215 [Gordonia sp. (in: high G+C Gram-positive bacteria)]